MSRNSSNESTKHPYTRPHAWINGIGDASPLIDNFTNRLALGKEISPRERVMNMLKTMNNQWISRPDNFREVNGYPEK